MDGVGWMVVAVSTALFGLGLGVVTARWRALLLPPLLYGVVAVLVLAADAPSTDSSAGEILALYLILGVTPMILGAVAGVLIGARRHGVDPRR